MRLEVRLAGSTLGSVMTLLCCIGAGTVGIVVVGMAGLLGNGAGITEPGAVGTVGTVGITGVGGATGAETPGAAGATGLAGMSLGGSDDETERGGITPAGAAFVGRLVAGIAGVEDFRLRMRLRRLRFSSGAPGVAAAAAGTLGTVAVAGAESRLNNRLPRPRRSLGSSDGDAAGGDEGFVVSANVVAGGFTEGVTTIGSGFFVIGGSVDFTLTGGDVGILGVTVLGTVGRIGVTASGGVGMVGVVEAGGDGGVLTGGNGDGITGVLAAGGAMGAGIAGFDEGLGAAGFSATGGFSAGGAGSISVNVSPLFASLTSVSRLPSGFFVDFTMVTVRSGWPGNLSVMVSPALGKSSAAEIAFKAIPAASAHAHLLKHHRVMIISPTAGRGSSMTAEASVRRGKIGLPRFSGTAGQSESAALDV